MILSSKVNTPHAMNFRAHLLNGIVALPEGVIQLLLVLELLEVILRAQLLLVLELLPL